MAEEPREREETQPLGGCAGREHQLACAQNVVAFVCRRLVQGRLQPDDDAITAGHEVVGAHP